MNITSENFGYLGTRFWTNFMEQNKKCINTQIPDRIDVNWQEWCNYDYFDKMYNLVYNGMQEARLVRKFDEPVFMDLEGNIVDDSKKAAGLPVELDLVDLEFVIFWDECDTNLNMIDDNIIRGEMFVTSTDAPARESISSEDKHFTIIGFMTAIGKPIMCAVILSRHSVDTYTQIGIDIRKNILPSTRSTFEDFGPGKRYPGGPICSYNGKEVPCLICCSPKGRITSELLFMMLQRMDDLNLFLRSKNWPSSLLNS